MGKISVQSLALEGDEDGDQLRELSDEELQEVDAEQLQYQRAVMEEQIKGMKPNMAAVEEYKRKVSRLVVLFFICTFITHSVWMNYKATYVCRKL